MNHLSFDKIFLGNSVFTIVSKKTSARFTYRLFKRSDKVWFLSVLTGSDNNSSYSYLGTFKPDKGLEWSLKSTISPSSLSWTAIKYLFSHPLSPFIELYHEGRCCKCGKRLTTPESIKSGVGPKCR